MSLASVLYCFSDLGAFPRFFPDILGAKDDMLYVKEFSRVTGNTQHRFQW